MNFFRITSYTSFAGYCDAQQDDILSSSYYIIKCGFCIYSVTEYGAALRALRAGSGPISGAAGAAPAAQVSPPIALIVDYLRL